MTAVEIKEFEEVMETTKQQKVMSKEQQQIIDETYENYCKKSESQFIPNFEDGTMTIISPASHYNFLSQEKFINKCKTDTEFSEKWGLTIKERELSLEERKNIWLLKNSDKPHLLYHPGMVEKSHPLTTPQNWFDEQNIPTKLITVTYNDKTIESYE